MKILLIQHRAFLNGSGGTEKVCSFLANEFVKFGYDVGIATNDPVTGKPFFPLDKKVKVTNVYNPYIVQKTPKPLYNYQGKNPFLWIKYKVKKKYAKAYNHFLYKKMKGKDGLYTFNLRQKSKAWNQYIQQLHPDVIITMSVEALLEITYENNFTAAIVNSTNGRPDYDYTNALWHRSNLELNLLKDRYKHLAAMQVLFESYKDYLPDTFKGKCAVIANPVPQVAAQNTADCSKQKNRYRIVQIASLNFYHKQQDVSVDVFSNIASQYPDWDLFFWGEGRDRERLKSKITETGLQNRIFLMGLTDDPLSELRNADIFIFPSRFEGLPLALLEAMSAGLPSLGFISCSGVNELIHHGGNGFLAANKTDMQQYLEQLIRNPELRRSMGENAHNSMKAYHPEIISARWKALVEEVANGK